MAYAIGYCVHTWEMFVVRSWVVTFLVFTAAQPGEQVNFLVPTVVAMLMELVGTATSVLGNEMAVRFGRQRWIMSVMLAPGDTAWRRRSACCTTHSSTQTPLHSPPVP
jgi:hypothetical protein